MLLRAAGARGQGGVLLLLLLTLLPP